MQLVNLTVYKKNGNLTTQSIAVDVDDFAGPIRFNSNSKSYFLLNAKNAAFNPSNTIQDSYEVIETLAAIQAISEKLLLLTVTQRRLVTVTTEQMIFNAGRIIGPFSAIGAGTEFLYYELGNPEPVRYVVSEDIATIMLQQVVTGTVRESVITAESDETTLLTTGTSVLSFRMPYALTLTKVKASLNTAPGAGVGIFTVDVKKNGTTIFSTKITIDNAETTSETAAIPSVLSTTAFANDDIMTIDINDIGGGAGTGLKVTFIGHQ